MGRTQELPSRSYCIARLRRAEIAEAESKAELRASSEENAEDAEVILVENSNSGEITDETLQVLPAVRIDPPHRVDIFRAVEKKNLNTVLTNPNSVKVTESLIQSLIRQPERVVRFAKRLWHKGKLHPAVARELGMESRRNVKASIIEQTE